MANKTEEVINTSSCKTATEKDIGWLEGSKIQQEQEIAWLSAAFGKDIKQLTQDLEHEKEEDSILAKLKVLDAVIGEVANELFGTFVEKERVFYEKLLDIPLELKIPDLMFTFVKSHATVESVNKGEEIMYRYTITPCNVDVVTKCMSVLAHIASGTEQQTEAVTNTGIVQYAMNFTLDKRYQDLSMNCIKLLACILSNDEDFQYEICDNLSYVDRLIIIFDLFQDPSLETNEKDKAWLMIFCNGLFEIPDTVYSPAVNSCFAAAFSNLLSDYLILVQKSVILIGTLAKNLMEDPDCIFLDLIGSTVPRLVSLLAPGSQFLTDEVLGTLISILCQYAFNKEQIFLSAVSSGLMAHISVLLHSENTVVVTRTLALTSVLVSYEGSRKHVFESVYGIIPKVCFYLTSKSKSRLVRLSSDVIVKTLEYVSDELLFAIHPDPFVKDVKANPEIYHSALKALDNLKVLEKDEDTDMPWDIFNILSDCLRSVQYVITFGHNECYGFKRPIAKYCAKSKDSVLETLRFTGDFVISLFKDGDTYYGSKIADVQERILEMETKLDMIEHQLKEDRA